MAWRCQVKVHAQVYTVKNKRVCICLCVLCALVWFVMLCLRNVKVVDIVFFHTWGCNVANLTLNNPAPIERVKCCANYSIITQPQAQWGENTNFSLLPKEINLATSCWKWPLFYCQLECLQFKFRRMWNCIFSNRLHMFYNLVDSWDMTWTHLLSTMVNLLPEETILLPKSDNQGWNFQSDLGWE